MKSSIPSASRENEGLRVPGISREREFPLMAEVQVEGQVEEQLEVQVQVQVDMEVQVQV